MQLLVARLAVLIPMLTVGCAEGNFSGDNKRPTTKSRDAAVANDRQDTPAAPALGGNAPGTADGNDSGDATGTKPADAAPAGGAANKPVDMDAVRQLPGGDALAACLTQWGDAPFTMDEIAHARRLDAVSTGIGDATLEDAKQTDKPRLVLVSAVLTGIGSARIGLFNANGWYCLDVGATGIGDIRVYVHPQAELARSVIAQTGIGDSAVVHTESFPGAGGSD